MLILRVPTHGFNIVSLRISVLDLLVGGYSGLLRVRLLNVRLVLSVLVKELPRSN